MSDQFVTWRKLLVLAAQHKTKAAYRAAVVGSGISVFENDPHSGYYRCAAVKDGPLLPVAIWRDGDNALNVMRGAETVPLDRVWPYAVWNPVSYEAYEAVTERGEPWPDDGTVTLAEELRTIPTEAAVSHSHTGRGIGDNKPPDEDEVTALRNLIEAAKHAAESEYGKIDDDDTAAKAQSLRSRLNELSGTADKKREAEKKPHFEAAKAVDAKWQPLVKLAKGAADAIRDKLSDYATRKAKAEADAARLAAEKNPPADGEQQAPAPQEPAKPVAFKGATGRVATVKAVNVAVITDQDKAYAYFRELPEIKEAIQKAAQRHVDAGHKDIPGVSIDERRRVA